MIFLLSSFLAGSKVEDGHQPRGRKNLRVAFCKPGKDLTDLQVSLPHFRGTKNSGPERSKDLPKITQGVAWVSWAQSSLGGAPVGRPSDILILCPAPLPKMKWSLPGFGGSVFLEEVCQVASPWPLSESLGSGEDRQWGLC